MGVRCSGNVSLRQAAGCCSDRPLANHSFDRERAGIIGWMDVGMREPKRKGGMQEQEQESSRSQGGCQEGREIKRGRVGHE